MRLRIYLHCSSSSSCLRHPVGERARKEKAAAMADNCDPVLPTSFEVLSYRWLRSAPHLPCHIPFSFSQVNRGPSKNLNANLGSSRSGCQWLCLCLPAIVDDGFFPALSVFLSTRPIARSLALPRKILQLELQSANYYNGLQSPLRLLPSWKR